MFVAYSYKLYNDADNSLLFETPAGDPDTMIFGVSRDVVPGLETAMEGLATGDRFVADVASKEALDRAFGAAACDMEGGAIAQVCVEMNTPYAAYRVISDTLRGNEQDYEKNVAAAGLSSQRLLRALLAGSV